MHLLPMSFTLKLAGGAQLIIWPNRRFNLAPVGTELCPKWWHELPLCLHLEPYKTVHQQRQTNMFLTDYSGWRHCERLLSGS